MICRPQGFLGALPPCHMFCCALIRDFPDVGFLHCLDVQDKPRFFSVLLANLEFEPLDSSPILKELLHLCVVFGIHIDLGFDIGDSINHFLRRIIPEALGKGGIHTYEVSV
ncbi:MAG: hypothetical protein A4E63_02174 [Syntrophorhabdus sp. PtaU1.Bin050]|nr:MAG: hypothetical protein A4E63_02174 [Syntrophorhabdus sp. PtaU1.Bin050]